MTKAEEMKKYLGRYKEICCEIAELKEELMFLKSVTEYKSVNFGGVGGAAGVFDKIGVNAAKIMDLEKETENKIALLTRICGDIKRRIDALPNPLQRKILTERYIGQKRWEQIAIDVCVGERWMFRLHKSALEQMAEKENRVKPTDLSQFLEL